MRCLSRSSRCATAVAFLLAASAAQPGLAAGAGEFTIPARRAARPPDIDGHITEREWRGAARAENFLQFQPRRGDPAELPTVVHVLYDDESLYVGFQAWDPEPALSQMVERDDPIWNDDSLQVFLDTFHDRRTGYYFMVNGLGTQSDGRIAADGGTSDGAWDAPWRSAQRTDYGWSAEIAIPLTSIQYRAGDDVTWGINFGRSRRRSLERTFWAGPVDYWARLSMAGTLVGLDIPQQSRRHQIIPYALSRAQERERPLGAVGLDVRYAVTPHLSAYGTVNPDFATIEADQELVNLTRFEVSLTEKRQFFLEGRRALQPAHPNLLLAPHRGHRGRRQVPGEAGTVGHARAGHTGRPVGYRQQRRLHGGAGAAGRGGALERRRPARQPDAGRAEPGLGGRRRQPVLHGELGPDRPVRPQLRAVLRRGRRRSFVRPVLRLGDRPFPRRLHPPRRPAWPTTSTRSGSSSTTTGARWTPAANKTVWLLDGPIERIQYDSAYDAYWGQTGIAPELAGGRVDRRRFPQPLDDHGAAHRGVQALRAGLSEPADRRRARLQHPVLPVLPGRVDDRARNFDADFVLGSVVAQYKPTDRTSTEYELQRLTLDPDPGDGGTWIHVVRASRFFTPDLFLRLFLQTNSAIDRRNVQAVFVYRYRPPFGTLQVAYQRGTAEFGQRSDQGHTLFLKITTVL